MTHNPPFSYVFIIADHLFRLILNEVSSVSLIFDAAFSDIMTRAAHAGPVQPFCGAEMTYLIHRELILG